MALTQVDQGLLGTYAQYTGFKNRIINGAMMIDQRNAGASVTTAGGTNWIVDRFRLYVTQASKFSGQQNAGSVTPPTGFKNYLGATVISAYTPSVASDEFFVGHKIEGYNIADFGWGANGASPVTLSFWVRSSLTGTFSGFVRTSSGDVGYVYTYTINSQNTWEYKTISISGPTSGTWVTDNGTGISMGWCLGGNAAVLTSTVNTWGSGAYSGASSTTQVVSNASATFYITGVQLEKGSTATSFDYRPYGTELALCQRYYYKVKPATDSFFGNCLNWNSTASIVQTPFPVTMRTAPTAVEQSGTAADYRLAVGTSGTLTCSGVPTFDAANMFSGTTDFTVASGLTAGQTALARNASGFNGYLAWSAEL